MKKNIFLMLLLLVCAVGVYAQVLDRTVAKVKLYKTEIVTQSKLNQQLDIWTKQTNQKPTDDVKEKVLTATINDILISQAAEKSGVVATNQQIDEAINLQKSSLGTAISDDELKKLVVSQSGLSWEEYRFQIKNRIIQEQYILRKYEKELNSFSAPSEQEIEETYERHATEFSNPVLVRISHLFWEIGNKNKEQVKQIAEDVATKINKKVDKFDEYEQKALDDPSFEGGDLGYLVKDENTDRILGFSFVDAVFRMKKGQVSGVLESNIGYHIVKVEDRRSAKILALDDPVFPGEKSTVRDRVKQLLSSQKQQDYFLDLVKKEVDSLREKAKINILISNY